FTVVANCNATIATITEGRTCGPGTVDLEATSSVVVPAVSEYRWYSTPTGSTLLATTTAGTWTTPSINTTTTYYVTAYNGCESLTRTPIKAIVSPVPNLTYLPISPVSCGEDVGVELSASGDVEEVYLIDEDFDSGLGSFTNTNFTTSVRDADTQWQNRTSTYIPTAISGTNTWYPAISSGINADGFVMATSDYANAIPYVHNQVASSAVSTVNFTSLTLNLRLFYSRYFIDNNYPAEEFVTIDVSTNNGANWIEIKRFTEDVGIGTKFEDLTYDLSSYVGVSQFKVRVRYYNNNWCDGIAVDDIELFGNRPNVNLNWTTTIPAFTDATCTIAYNPLTTAAVIYVKPTLAQLESNSFTFTANAVLDNGCITSQVISVTNNSKIWQGTNSDWNDDNNWKPIGKPSLSNCIIIPDTAIDPIISGTSYDAFGKNITIKTGAVLTINSENNITITDEVFVKTGGLFDIKNSASLIQTNDSAINSGSIKMTRTSRAMTRWAYVYWGSPIVENAYSQIPTQFDLKYRWQSGTSAGSWLALSSVSQGNGFITRVKNIAPFSTGVGTIDFIFNGTPGNGVVNVPVDSFDSSSMVAGNTVLLANPYPSAVDAATFLTHSNNTELGGTLFFWTSLTFYSGGGAYNVLDYGSWNLSGGTGTSPASDPTNLSLKPNGKIAAGQGFFAQVFADGNITFNNSMRAVDFNNQFFRTNNNTTYSDSQNNRFWLNLYNNNTFRQMMVNYKSEATNGFDRLYDGNSFTSNEIDIYSTLESRNLVIQGRALPFDQNDVVSMGYRVTNGGQYTIAIDEMDGLFAENQTIFLRDNLLGIDHNIKESTYSFTTAAGTFNNRFEIVYVNALVTNNPRDVNIFATISNNTIKIESSEFIKTVNIYDISGKLINRYNLANATKQLSDNFNYPNGIYIAEITLENDMVVKKKLIH
ncbi:MAG: T9SS type A sorting domain-containing protein, partial [Flavobacterium sp.]|nr:T9SS type A sorting domain-containing protein [Flavobacterium sp.]